MTSTEPTGPHLTGPSLADQALPIALLPESRLPDELLAQLPTSTPAPPWNCRVRATVWWQRAPSPLPSSSPYAGRVRPLAAGAMVDYLESPVGPYREVFVGQLLRGTMLPVLHVPFIAVDSLASVHGGRAHWALPKALASFEGDPGSGQVTARGAETAGSTPWSVQVHAEPRGPRLPLVGPLWTAQAPTTRAKASLRGTGRLALVTVSATGLTLPGWLTSASGPRHLGVVAEGRMQVHPPLG